MLNIKVAIRHKKSKIANIISRPMIKSVIIRKKTEGNHKTCHNKFIRFIFIKVSKGGESRKSAVINVALKSLNANLLSS